MAQRSRVLESESRLEHDLIMPDLAVLHMPSCLHDLNPLQISQRLTGTLDGGIDRILNAARRRADQFNDFVDMIRHYMHRGHFLRRSDPAGSSWCRWHRQLVYAQPPVTVREEAIGT